MLEIKPGVGTSGPRTADNGHLTTVDVGPLRIARATMRTALELTDSLIHDGSHHFVCFCEANLLHSVLRDARLARTLRSADAIFADGISMMLLARLQGRLLPGRVSGPSFMPAACAFGVKQGWRHFFYGGNEGVAERLAERFQREYPGLVVAGAYCPPFRPLTPAEDLEVKQRIEAAKPDLLWVCLGSPNQERWCADHLGRLDVPLMLAVGAAFDFHSGNRPWAPKWVRATGMEWAFRAITGGKRTFLRNVLCVSSVAVYLVKQTLNHGRTSRDIK